MRYFVVAFDFRDPECLERRMTHRPAHLEMVEQLHTRGQLLFGGAILDDKGNMIGSGQIVDFPDVEALNNWLAIEPYVLGKVWENISVHPYRVGPLFDRT